MTALFREPLLKTLAYHDLFDFPLTEAEIYRWLISSERAAPSTLAKSLAKLVSEGVVVQEKGYYCLAGREEIIPLREARQKISSSKRRRARVLSWLARGVPWVQLVAVTGRVAVANSDWEDDIDWLVVTSPRRLWLSRLLLVSLLRLTSQYRRPQQFTNKICPNVWLTSDHLKAAKASRDLFLAHEIAQLDVLWQRRGVKALFFRENGWVEKFLVHALIDQNDLPHQALRSKRLPLVGQALNLLERVAGWAQKRRMASKITSETIADSALHFQTHDNREWILPAYRRRLERLGLA